MQNSPNMYPQNQQMFMDNSGMGQINQGMGGMTLASPQANMMGQRSMMGQTMGKTSRNWKVYILWIIQGKSFYSGYLGLLQAWHGPLLCRVNVFVYGITSCKTILERGSDNEKPVNALTKNWVTRCVYRNMHAWWTMSHITHCCFMFPGMQMQHPQAGMTSPTQGMMGGMGQGTMSGMGQGSSMGMQTGSISLQTAMVGSMQHRTDQAFSSFGSFQKWTTSHW